MSVHDLLVSTQPMAADVYTMSGGRIGAIIGGLTGLSGIGTGNGRGGAYVGLIVGTVSVVLGALALARSRRTT